MAKSGIILIDKNPGQTTLKEEMGLRRKFHTLKTGHSGTLDPFASGLLVIGVNQGTKVLPYFEADSKTYTAILQLGEKRDTGDIDGKTIEEKECHNHTEEEIREVLNSFIGESEQIPPMYSAVKKNGIPLYKYAYSGQEIKRKPRKVNISSLKLLSYDNEKNAIAFEADVSKGTYIRTLGEDIASKLNEVGYLSSLRRTRVGDFQLENAKTTDEATEDDIILIASLFSALPKYKVSKEEIEKRIYNGADLKLNIEKPYPAEVMLIRDDGEAVSIYKKADDNWYKPEKQFFTL